MKRKLALIMAVVLLLTSLGGVALAEDLSDMIIAENSVIASESITVEETVVADSEAFQEISEEQQDISAEKEDNTTDSDVSDSDTALIVEDDSESLAGGEDSVIPDINVETEEESEESTDAEANFIEHIRSVLPLTTVRWIFAPLKSAAKKRVIFRWKSQKTVLL